jgi:hypothetical protein
MIKEPYVIPWKVVIDPPQVSPGTSARITVQMTASCVGDTNVAIAATPSGFWTNMPSSITIPDGEDEASFDATTAVSASGASMVTATANGQMAAGACTALVIPNAQLLAA